MTGAGPCNISFSLCKQQKAGFTGTPGLRRRLHTPAERTQRVSATKDSCCQHQPKLHPQHHPSVSLPASHILRFFTLNSTENIEIRLISSCFCTQYHLNLLFLELTWIWYMLGQHRRPWMNHLWMQFMVKAQENEADISKCTVREKHFPMKGIRLPLDPTGKRRGGGNARWSLWRTGSEVKSWLYGTWESPLILEKWCAHRNKHIVNTKIGQRRSAPFPRPLLSFSPCHCVTAQLQSHGHRTMAPLQSICLTHVISVLMWNCKKNDQQWKCLWSDMSSNVNYFPVNVLSLSFGNLIASQKLHPFGPDKYTTVQKFAVT